MKTSQYMNIIQKNDGSMILHNALFGSVMRITDPELQKLAKELKEREDSYSLHFDLEKMQEFYDDLAAQNMIVEDHINEINMINNRFRELGVQRSRNIGIVMIPTRNCNFRCPYCYEEHVNKNMDDQTYEKALNFLSKAIEEKKCENVGVSWFGGEPMLAYEKVIAFMEKLKEQHPEVKLHGQMTTNGYLLTKERLQTLIDHDVTMYQITVDGMADVHDQTRFLAGGAGSWDTIIENLRDAKKLEADFKITIRTNLSHELMKAPDAWFTFLKENFGDDHRFEYHCESIKDLGGDDQTLVYEEQKHGDPMEVVLALSKKYGLTLNNYATYLKPFSMMCYAANPNTFVVDYDGSIEKCTVALDLDLNKVGHLTEQGASFDLNKFAWWTDYDNREECKKCAIYPLCYGRKCPHAYFHAESCQSMLALYNGVIRTLY